MTRRVLWMLLLAAPFAVLARYVLIALGTVGYDCQLEWMEGGVLDVIARAADGEPLYVAPSLEYVPHIYPPVYFWVAGALAKVFGLSFAVPRLVSLAATVGVFALLAVRVRREGCAWGWGVFAAALFAATYELSGRWFHLARVDTLALCLAMLSFEVLLGARRTRALLAAVALAAVASLTKQQMFVVLAPAFLGWWASRRAVDAPVPRGLVFGLVVFVVALLAWLRTASDGWFWYYVVELPRAHKLLDEALWGFWRQDLMPVGVALGASVITVAWLRTQPGRRAMPYAGLLLGALVSAWISRMHSGGQFNVVMPVHAVVAMLTGLGLGELHAATGGRARVAAAPFSPVLLAAAAAATYQLAILPVQFGAAFPAKGSAERCAAFPRFVESIPGEVLLPDYRDPRAMKNAQFGLEMPARDVLRAPEGDRGRSVLEPALREAIAAKRFRAIILSEPVDWAPYLAGHYVQEQVVDLAPKPVTGWVITPRAIFVPAPPR